MKAAFLCCILLLAGTASCSSVEANSISLPDITIPDWIIDLIGQLPDSIQNIIEKLPEIIAAIPEILQKIPEIIAQIIEKIPEVIPIIIDKLPEIIAQIPEIIAQIPAIIGQIIDKIPELIPIILEKIPEIIAAIPDVLDKIKEIYDKIRDILEDLDLPDWFPTLPELEKPEWWPDELPTLPDYNRPIAGTPAAITDRPGIVQIEVGTGPVWVQGCAGSILTSFHVLSAARCFSGRLYADRFRRIRAGSSTRYTDGSIVQVERVTKHPDFDNRFSTSDIAVVRLTNNLILSASIQQTPIVPQDFVLPSGIAVDLAGWGSTAQGRRITNRDLYEIDLVVVDNAECASRWNKIPVFSIDSNTLCVGRSDTGGRNSDVRDIGAPVYFDGILVGIVSFGVPYGNEYFPVVTTSVSSFTQWVVDNAN